MKVTVCVAGWFKRYTDGLSCLEQEISNNETAWEVVCRTGIPRDEIGFITVCSKGQNDGESSNKVDGKVQGGCEEQPCMEKRVDETYMVVEGDVLNVYPFIIGG